MALLEIKQLSKHYGKLRALDDFSLRLSGGICGLLGPNGAGKSTLMKLISDNLQRQRGEILFDGEEIQKQGAKFRSLLGYMPQEQGMYENMSAYAFLFYIANLKGIEKKEAKKQIDALLAVVNLSSAAHKKLKSCSGGMRQRVMLVQALLGDARLLVLDEPTVGLDPQERLRLCTYLKGIAKDKIVLWSTHIVKEIEQVADSIAIMKKGRLLLHGSVEEILLHTGAKDLEEAYLYCMEEEDAGV